MVISGLRYYLPQVLLCYTQHAELSTKTLMRHTKCQDIKTLSKDKENRTGFRYDVCVGTTRGFKVTMINMLKVSIKQTKCKIRPVALLMEVLLPLKLIL